MSMQYINWKDEWFPDWMYDWKKNFFLPNPSMRLDYLLDERWMKRNSVYFPDTTVQILDKDHLKKTGERQYIQKVNVHPYICRINVKYPHRIYNFLNPNNQYWYSSNYDYDLFRKASEHVDSKLLEWYDNGGIFHEIWRKAEIEFWTRFGVEDAGENW